MAQVNEVLPEIDACYKVTDELRVWMQAKENYEAGDPVTAEFGPSLDFYLKPMVRLENITTFDLDDSKSRPLIFSTGYRYLPYPSSPPTNRMEPIVTFNFPVPKLWLLVTDRNRGDLDWQNGGFTWRYRNRLQLERNAKIHSYHLQPYVSAEFFYESLPRMPLPNRQARRNQSLLRTPEPDRQKPESAVQPVRLDREPLLRPTIADGI